MSPSVRRRGVCRLCRPGETGRVLGDLAEQTGGRLFKIESTRSLSRVFLEVLDELRQRYLVSYSRRALPQEGWHQLTVPRRRAGAPRLRARPGYVAGQ